MTRDGSGHPERWTRPTAPGPYLPVDVRGVFPFAGDPGAEGQRQDGPGPGARFREAFDAVVVSAWRAAPGWGGWDLVVTDPRAHVLRRVTQDGEVSTWCGVPDQAGHQDAPGWCARMGSWSGWGQPAPPRFNRPTYLIQRASPGRAGTLDGLQASTRFTGPKGLAWKDQGVQGGVLYVLDGHAVRAVSFPGGVVTTVLGQVGGFQGPPGAAGAG
jgi:hypothetical protein